ncbi:HTTM domain-containing protein [Romeria aff. gracilis LEGE 07310]|uniref:HTTM domain-containing protein n=1 Tax=Vasconcelosia minhoensis LEGE 07310 TaxID=915328 RepID=A0A8J7AAL8_9CYAN|nr:HTTM domain-containing protein [Romeria gracilis]MBE9075929.1 HTTM domain-containing protein [Romeria aff. gracilis LEGE 07310]
MVTDRATTTRWVKPLSKRYGLDLRSLALLRMGLALVILADLGIRFGDVTALYSDAGVLPRQLLLEEVLQPWYWSLHLLSGQPLVQGLMFAAAAFFALAMLVGYQTRLATIASWALLVSLHNRNPLLIFAADDVLRAVMFWAMFLPLGAAYSIDRAMNTSSQPLPRRIFTAATVALMVQQCFIYWFSALFKTTSPDWWPSGSAVYYSLSYDQYATPLGHLLLGLGPLLTVLTLVTLVVEWVGPLLLWVPIRTDFFRMLAVILFIALHAGFGLTLNIGIFPFLSIVTWLAFIPTSVWEGWARKAYGPAQQGLTIYYDADCGFCKKVVHLIRTFLLLPQTPLQTAQSDPVINAAMETQNSWVVVDWQQRHHYKFEGIAYVVSLSPVFCFLAPLLRWRPVMAVGTRFYQMIANNRRAAGRLTRPFSYRSFQVGSSWLLNGAVIALLGLTFLWNLRSIVTHRAFVDSQNPAAKVVRKVTNSRTLQRVDWLSRLTRLDQSWSIFAPGAPKDDGWHVAVGQLADGREVDLLREGREVGFEKPSLRDRGRLYRNMQWRTLFINLNRNAGQRILPGYGRYLCRQQPELPLKSVTLYFMDEQTVPPGQEQTVRQTEIWQQSCSDEP